MEQKLPKAGRPRSFDDATARRAIQDVFWKQGFAATSLDDLSTATGLHKPSLYGAFGNKQAMFTDSFRGYLRDVGEAMTAALAKPKLADALSAHFTFLTAAYVGDKARLGCFMATAAAPLAASDPEIAARIRRAMAALEDRLTVRLTQAERDGDLAPAFDPLSATDLLLGTQLRLSMLARTGEPAAMLNTIWRRAVRAVTA